MNNYDVIIVGANNSGLVSALSLIKKGYKVLILEAHSNIGGLSNVIKKGRFEFENSIHNLYLNQVNERVYSLTNILKECGVNDDINYSLVPELFRVITPNHDFTMPFGIEEYKKKVLELVPNSEASLNTFFELALECREAMDYVVLNKDNLDYDYIKSEYNNFMRIASYSISKVLDAIDMPIEAQEIINSMWIYLGSSETELSFVEYAIFLLNAIEYGLKVPTNKNYDISLTLANKFLEKGGTLKLNSKVVKLLIDENKVNGVRLLDGSVYYANHIVANTSLNNVYGKLLNPDEAPREALKNINKRELGGRLFTVHLGLNRSAEALGLNNYSYIIYHSLDSDIEFNRMKEIANGNQIAIVRNNAVKDASPLGTCVISLNTIYFDDCFGKYVEEDRYFIDEREIAQRLIDVFQKYTRVKIMDYIEEIEIVSPLNNVVVNDSPEGCVYGYRLTGMDNLLPRILNSKNENYIEGLYVGSGFDGDLYGYNSSFVKGLECATEIKLDDKGDK